VFKSFGGQLGFSSPVSDSDPFPTSKNQGSESGLSAAGCFCDEDLELALFRWAHAQSAFFGP
jgi:hypothetical protein